MAADKKPIAVLLLLLLINATILVVDCSMGKRSAFPALARKHEHNQLAKTLIKEIQSLRLLSRSRRFASTRARSLGEMVAGRTGEVVPQSPQGYDLNKFILESSYMPHLKVDSQDGMPTRFLRAQLEPDASWSLERKAARCTRPELVVGPSGYRMMCLNPRTPELESISPILPDELVEVEAQQLLNLFKRALQAE